MTAVHFHKRQGNEDPGSGVCDCGAYLGWITPEHEQAESQLLRIRESLTRVDADWCGQPIGPDETADVADCVEILVSSAGHLRAASEGVKKASEILMAARWYAATYGSSLGAGAGVLLFLLVQKFDWGMWPAVRKPEVPE